MKITYVSCFCTKEPSSGNRAAVVEEFVGDENDKQSLATQLNFPVTVFIKKTDDIFSFRFFYPSREMPLCIHGALCAAYVLMTQSGLHHFRAITKENQELIAKKSEDIIQLEIKQGQVLPLSFLQDDVEEMLGIHCQSALHKSLPHCIATIGSPKLLVPLINYETIASLEPNFAFIKQWSLRHNVNGLYVYTDDTREKGVDFIARGFNPKGGSNEDAATGVAAGALYSALEYSDKQIQVRQGNFIANPSCMVVSSENGKLFIGGKIRIDSYS